MNPTDEQQREFWEWCGLRFKEDWPTNCVAIIKPNGYAEYPVIYPDGREFVTPYLDLNNLFLYAVPKLPYVVLENCQAGYRASVSGNMKDNPIAYDKNPALALFWAIWEVIHG